MIFKKSTSLKRLTPRLVYKKFINLAMVCGKFVQIQRIIIQTLTQLFEWIKYNIIYKNNYIYDINYLLLFSNLTIFTPTQNIYKYFLKNTLMLNFLHNIFEENISVNTNFYMKFFLLAKINSVKPLFLFHIYKINKFIRKYSRGKSGKYTLVWKYIPIYKRQFIIMR